jgi:hypothetical protein
LARNRLLDQRDLITIKIEEPIDAVINLGFRIGDKVR